MEEKITQVFKSIGLSKNEIKVYLDLVKNEISSALDISRRIKIHRPNTYDALRTLIEKGFVKETVDGKRKLFSSVNPKKITEYVLQKKQEVDSIIPYLVNFSENNGSEESVFISKGVFALRNALLSLLESGNQIDVYGIPINAVEILGEGFLQDFHRRRVHKKIFMRHIYSKEAIDRMEDLNKLEHTEARHLASKYDSHVSTNICGDCVIIIIFSNPVSVIEIKSREIAKTYSKYFDILWNHAKTS